MSVRESCWMLVSAFLFALMALFVKLSTAYYGVMEIIFYRSVLGVLFVGEQMAARHISFRPYFVSHHIARCLVGTLSISLGVYVLGFCRSEPRRRLRIQVRFSSRFSS